MTKSKAPDPRQQFDSPEALLASPDLSDEEKQALLTEWDSEIDGRLNAESEGMSAADPITAGREARLADEAGKVKTALTEIAQKTEGSNIAR
jgi:hypothetical protein